MHGPYFVIVQEIRKNFTQYNEVIYYGQFIYINNY